MTTELYSARKEKERMGKIIDIYIEKSENHTNNASNSNNNEPIDTNKNINDVNGPTHMEKPTSKTSNKKCRYEINKKDSCRRRNQCQFDHDVSDAERNTNINDPRNSKDICETVFRNKSNSCSNKSCSKKHNIDLVKLKRGICYYELKQKDLCKFKMNCLYSHDIPSKCRNDPELIKETELAIAAWKAKTNVDKSIPPCPDEFYDHQCNNTERCKFRHGIDKSRIKRGPCLFEFYKENSCPHGRRCRFNHDIPSECLSDNRIVNKLLEKISNSNNKDKIEGLLGRSCRS